MKRPILTIVALTSALGLWAQEPDFFFADNDSIGIIEAADSTLVDSIASDLENEMLQDFADTEQPTDSTLTADDLDEANDTIRRKPEIHPLRKGSYFHIGIGAGVSDLLYTIDAGTQYVLPSLTANLGYTYFFVPTVGIGTGVHVSHYGSVAKITGEYGKSFWDNVYDSENELYNHRTRMNNWKERQVIYMIEIPLALHFQQNWGYRTGLYAQVGAKFGMPIFSDYKVIGGSMTHVGEYPQYDWKIIGLNENAHGFGLEENQGQTASITSLPSSGNRQYKYNVAAFFEIGALFQLSKRVDMFLGIYANYGFTNIDPYKDSKKPNIGFKNDWHKFMNDYNGVIATSQVHGRGIGGGINALSGGIKIGLNIFAGRTEPKEKKEKEKKKKHEPEPKIIYVYDTIRVQDTIVISDTVVLHNTEFVHDTIVLTKQDTIIQATESLDNLLRQAVIYFDFDKWDPKLQPADILDRVAAELIKHREMGIEVNGHACKTGSDEYNQRLSMKRARAVADLLRQKGVYDSQMKVQSFGSTKPFRYNEFAHQKSKDRRVEIIPIGQIDATTQQQQAAEAHEAKQNEDGIVNKTEREIPQIEIDGKMVPIFLKYTEFIGEETVRRGMSLAQLSRKWYKGEQAFWVYIFEANMYQIPDPNDIEPGTILMIPKLDPAVGDPRNPECIRIANELKEKYLAK